MKRSTHGINFLPIDSLSYNCDVTRKTCICSQFRTKYVSILLSILAIQSSFLLIQWCQLQIERTFIGFLKRDLAIWYQDSIMISNTSLLGRNDSTREI